MKNIFSRLPPNLYVATGTVVGIILYLALRYATSLPSTYASVPLILILTIGGGVLLTGLVKRLVRLQFGSDLLAGISILTSLALGEYLAGSIVVLMLSGGEALEGFAITRASSVLNALAKRMPTIAHRRLENAIKDIPTDQVSIGDTLVIFPHELCPVDGTVLEGEGAMDESFLTGEPFKIRKTSGCEVISGAINGEVAITIVATKRSVDSRYAKIVKVMEETELGRPHLRRLGDKLGAFYTPLALGLAALAWIGSGDPTRFLSVLVVATPCPLLIAIPVAVIGSISLAAKRGIVIKNAAIFEQLGKCRVILFDKTGTLTYGKPELAEISAAPGMDAAEVLKIVASLERYSKHPLSQPILEKAERDKLSLVPATSVSEKPGRGLTGTVSGRTVEVTSRKKFLEATGADAASLPAQGAGLECVILMDGSYAALLRFRDLPRSDSKSFVKHLGPQHQIQKVMLVSGDRESEVRYLAEAVGIDDVHFSQSPENKVALVRQENEHGGTLFMGDGINDAPALAAATVGIAMGQNSEITSEAADAVILDADLARVDELFHIGQRMYRIVLQSAVGGMLLSGVGMVFAATGYLTPVAGAITQEVIDLVAVLNALRAAVPPKLLTDFRR